MQTCDINQASELAFVSSIIIIFIAIVLAANYWNYKDHKKTMDTLYGKRSNDK